MDSFYNTFTNIMPCCISMSDLLYKILTTKLINVENPNQFTFDKYPDSFCFILYWDMKPIGLSISYPLDVNSNYVKHGWIIETALYNRDTKHIVYDDSVNYNDIHRFDTIDELLVEIKRLSALNQDNGEFVLPLCDSDLVGDLEEDLEKFKL